MSHRTNPRPVLPHHLLLLHLPAVVLYAVWDAFFSVIEGTTTDLAAGVGGGHGHEEARPPLASLLGQLSGWWWSLLRELRVWWWSLLSKEVPRVLKRSIQPLPTVGALPHVELPLWCGPPRHEIPSCCINNVNSGYTSNL